MQIITVLKKSEEYNAEVFDFFLSYLFYHNPSLHVNCLTDCHISHPQVTSIPLKHGWDGWWSKIEIFRPDLFTSPSLYLDVDSVIVGDISGITVEGFTMLPDILKSDGWYGSGAMGWLQTPHHLYEKFKERPDFYMQDYVTTQKWGDQGFIRDHLGEKPSVFGEEFRSYKMQCGQGIPEGTKIVYFHGHPRPWELPRRKRKILGERLLDDEEE